MAKVQYRIYDDGEGERRVDHISDDGMVTPLEAKAKDKKLEPGYYDAKFKLVEAFPPPDEEDDA